MGQNPDFRIIGSNPLPPPACPGFCVLRAISLAIGPSSRSGFQFELRTPLEVVPPRYSPKGSVLSEALDSAYTVRFSKFDCFELLMSFNGKWFGRFCRIPERFELRCFIDPRKERPTTQYAKRGFCCRRLSLLLKMFWRLQSSGDSSNGVSNFAISGNALPAMP
jgi:hypothetical protein